MQDLVGFVFNILYLLSVCDLKMILFVYWIEIKFLFMDEFIIEKGHKRGQVT